MVFYGDGIFKCHVCQMPLRVEKFVIRSQCNHPVKWDEYGIPLLIEKLLHYHDIDPVILSRVIARMDKEPWQKVVYDEIYPKSPYLYQMISEESRGDILTLFHLNQKQVVADLGSGFGFLALQLARYTNVIAVDAYPQRLAFVRAKASQERIRNCVTVCADICSLPIQDEALDGVFMIGLLEWVGRDEKKSQGVGRKQRKAIQEAARITKRGGFLCLGIENRYAVSYFLSKPEDHTGLPYLSLLERDRVDVFLRDKPYRTYTHTLREYHRLLRTCGYSQIVDYYPYPDYKTYSTILPLARAEIAKWYFSSLAVPDDAAEYPGMLFHQVAAKMGTLPIYANAFFIVARKYD